MPSAPKPRKRIVDRNVYKITRERDGFCLYGIAHQDGCMGRLHVHHIRYRGRGGDDTPENTIVLCAKHHEMVHRHDISEEELLRVRAIYHSDVGMSKRDKSESINEK